jgi:hypothetical protein
MHRIVIGKYRTKARSLNRRRAIRHHCLVCSDFNWEAVMACPRKGCSLFRFRTGTAGGNGECAEMRKEAIHRFCRACLGCGEGGPVDCGAAECALFDYSGGQTLNYELS